MFFIAVDSTRTQIYTTSPSGIYRPYTAYALGSGEAQAREYIQNNYKDDMSFNGIINLALNALKESIDEDLTKENIRIAYIKSEDKKYKLCSKDEVEKYISELK